MFLLALTKSDITDRLGSYNFEEFTVHSTRLTIVFDNFLSQIISEEDGLSVIESPLIFHGDPKEIILSQAMYSKEKEVLEVSVPFISGRPIYYHLDSKGNFYCSTHISMLRQAGVGIRENMMALPEFFVFCSTMPPQTLYENIWQLNLGSRLYVKPHNGKCKIEAINEFDPPKESRNPNLIKDFPLRTSNLLSRSIQSLGTCKNRLTVLLSGGLDSSLLLKTCQTLNYDVDTTYSTGYPFENFERDYALSAADYFGTNHKYHEITVLEYLRGLLETISVAEQPLPHMQSVLLYLLLKDGLPKSKDIVLNGQSADGLSCNSTSALVYKFRKRSIMYKLLQRMGKIPIVSHLPSTKWAIEFQSKIDCTVKDPNSVIWSSDAFGSIDWTSEYFNVKRGDIIKNRLGVIKQFGERSIYEIITIYGFLGSNANTQSIWSKLGESQQKIVYYPYNNSDLVNYFFSIPPDTKFKRYKHVLREVAHHCGLPKFIINRPKLGFNPLTTNPLVKEKIFEPLISVASKVFDEQQIRKVQPSDWGPKFWTFWNILNYSIWKRLWINNEPKEDLLEELTANDELISEALTCNHWGRT
jgi:hypothetical protein